MNTGGCFSKNSLKCFKRLTFDRLPTHASAPLHPPQRTRKQNHIHANLRVHDCSVNSKVIERLWLGDDLL